MASYESQLEMASRGIEGKKKYIYPAKQSSDRPIIAGKGFMVSGGDHEIVIKGM